MRKQIKNLSGKQKFYSRAIGCLALAVFLSPFICISVVVFVNLCHDHDISVHTTFSQIKAIESGVKVYHIRNGKYPESIQTLIDNKILSDNAGIDQFGNPIIYTLTDDSFEIRSAVRMANLTLRTTL